jgi:hypothetical protein
MPFRATIFCVANSITYYLAKLFLYVVHMCIYT